MNQEKTITSPLKTWVKTCRIFRPCFLAVEISELILAKFSTLSRARKPPEIFGLHFIIFKSISALALVRLSPRQPDHYKMLDDYISLREAHAYRLRKRWEYITQAYS